jgi:hypothetical protein
MTDRFPAEPKSRRAADQPPEPTFNRSVQRTMIMELILGGLLFAVLLGGAAYFGVIRPQMQNSPAIVLPVLETYMAAGKASDSVGAHRLFSRAGLRSVQREDLAATFIDYTLFENFDRFQFTAFSRSPAGNVAENEVVHVEAIVLYAGEPPATLVADLEREEDVWRLRSLTISRPEEAPQVVP